MQHKIYAYLSTTTGNTEKLAHGMLPEPEIDNWAVKLYKKKCVPKELEECALVIIFFWCRKSSMDDASRDFLNQCSGKKIIAVGTMGSYPESDYGNLVKSNVYSLIAEKNECHGVFLSQGKIAPERTEKRRKLPSNHPHYLSSEGLKRHMESRKHPNQEDMNRARRFLVEHLAEMNGVLPEESPSVCEDGEPCINCGMCAL